VAWAAVALAVWQCARRGWWIPVLGVAWYFLVMLPTSNVLVPIGTVRADRLQFAPSLGFALVCAWGASLLLARNRAAGVALVTIVSLGYAAVSIDRNRDWRSSETLWPVTLEQNPGNAVAWSFNADFRRDAARRALAEGNAEEAERLFEDAVVHYRRAMELRGQLGFYYRETANSLAAMQAERGLVDEARAIYEETVARQPRNPIAMINLAALVLSNERNPRRALDLLDRALALDPAQFAVWVNKSQAHNLLNEFDEALAAIEQAKALDPDHPQLPAAEQVIRDRMAATRAATPP
jgi:tetratricopeptide (TPR) repeat protein